MLRPFNVHNMWSGPIMNGAFNNYRGANNFSLQKE